MGISIRFAYWTDAELVLRDCCRVAGRSIEAARHGFGIAIAATPSIGRAVLGERRLIASATAGRAAARSWSGCLGAGRLQGGSWFAA